MRFTMGTQLPPNNWHGLITMDESWFRHEYIRDRIWTAWDETMAEMANRMIASSKGMLAGSWNPRGFDVVTILPPETLFNALWLVDDNLLPLLERFFAGGTEERENWMSTSTPQPHNARLTPDFFKPGPLKKLPQPRDSPDISPSNFDLIGFLLVVTEIVSGISGEELQAVFRSWIDVSSA
jgi:hypothetical protein